MGAFRMCEKCTRKRVEEKGDSWHCPYKRKKVYSDTDACEGFMPPLGHDNMWNNQEEIVLDI